MSSTQDKKQTSSKSEKREATSKSTTTMHKPNVADQVSHATFTNFASKYFDLVSRDRFLYVNERKHADQNSSNQGTADSIVERLTAALITENNQDKIDDDSIDYYNKCINWKMAGTKIQEYFTLKGIRLSLIHCDSSNELSKKIFLQQSKNNSVKRDLLYDRIWSVLEYKAYLHAMSNIDAEIIGLYQRRLRKKMHLTDEDLELRLLIDQRKGLYMMHLSRISEWTDCYYSKSSIFAGFDNVRVSNYVLKSIFRG